MTHHFGMRCAIAVLATAVLAYPAAAQTDDALLKQMQEQIRQLNQKMNEKDQQILELQQKLQRIEQSDQPQPHAPESHAEAHEHRPSAHDHDHHHGREAAIKDAIAGIDADEAAHHAQHGHDHDAVASVALSDDVRLRLMDISLNVLTAAGTSTETDDVLQDLQGGAHDPRKRGFTFQQAELSFYGAVDPYLTDEAHIIYAIDPLEGETIVELEEAFATTTSLPQDLELKAGFFFTEFGLINEKHPHEWDYLDQPIINTRIFGGDGMRQSGVRLGWLAPTPWYSEFHFGIQNANGETMASFLANDEFYEERAIGGRPFTERDVHSLEDLVYHARWVNSWELNEELTMAIGASGLFGPNASGNDAQSWVYGGDFRLTWKPRGTQSSDTFITWQSEVLGRHFEAASAIHPGPDETEGTADDVFLAADDLSDWGFYSQLLYGFTPEWVAGLRYEYATGSGPSVDDVGGLINRNEDPYRDDRHRVSPLLIWQPAEFVRYRLQYNYDHAAHLDGDAHSVWFGFEFLLGAHPAHTF